MKIQGLFAVANVADMAKAAVFYTNLPGRAPDDRPMDGLIQRRQDFFGVQLVRDAERAGKSMMTIVTPDMADTRQQRRRYRQVAGEEFDEERRLIMG